MLKVPRAIQRETPRLDEHVPWDAAWNERARRLVDSLVLGAGADLDPRLEQLLRRMVEEKARRFSLRLGERAIGVDPADVAQRVLLRLLESPPTLDPTSPPLRQLLAWVHVVTMNHLRDLVQKRSELLLERSNEPPIDRTSFERLTAEEGRFEAREMLGRLRPLVVAEYPAGVGVLELLLRFPHMTSEEIGRELSLSIANVDQIRARLRRLLRRHAGAGAADREGLGK